MNTIENKKKFFALYLGQEVTYPECDGLVRQVTKAILTGVSRDEIETTYKRKRKGISGDSLSWKENGHHQSNALNTSLLLKSVEAITDDHSRIIGELEGTHGDPVVRGRTTVQSLMKSVIVGAELQRIIDTLRDLGYSLPYLDISVEQQILYGWVKILKK